MTRSTVDIDKILRARATIREKLEVMQEHGVITSYKHVDPVLDKWTITFDGQTIDCKSSIEVLMFLYGINACARFVQKLSLFTKLRIRIKS